MRIIFDDVNPVVFNYDEESNTAERMTIVVYRPDLIPELLGILEWDEDGYWTANEELVREIPTASMLHCDNLEVMKIELRKAAKKIAGSRWQLAKRQEVAMEMLSWQNRSELYV